MTRDLEYNITAQDNGVTISDYLKKQGFSHAVIVQLKKIPESILLNGKWEYMSTRLNGGDCLFIHFEDTALKILLPPISLSPSVMKMRTF